MYHKRNSEWHENYFESPEYRLTAITESFLPKGYYQLFSNAYEVMQGNLMFRAKFSNNKEKKVNILTVWDSEKSYEKFSNLVDGKNWFDQFNKTDIVFHFEKREIEDAELRNIIVECGKQDNFLFQYVAQVYRNDNMTVGDPFKVNSNARS